MIVPDVNLLLYAYDQSSPDHAKAAAWWQACLSGTEPVGLPLVVAFGFLRLGNHPQVFSDPLTPAEAAQHIRSWLAQPVVQLLPHPDGHLDQVLTSLEQLGTAGNLVTDVQIAVLVLAHDAVLHTNDTDFQRFGGLRWFNPLTGNGGLRGGG